MPDVIERFLTAYADQATTTVKIQPTEEQAAHAEQLEGRANTVGQPGPIIKPGDPIIGWSYAGDIVWGGPGDRDPRFESYQISFNGPSTLSCPVTRVAPAGTPLADTKDPRIEIVHHKGYRTRNAAYWLKGDWHLTLTDIGAGAGWFKTKKDALAAAVRHLAIVDWHAANPQPDTDA